MGGPEDMWMPDLCVCIEDHLSISYFHHISLDLSPSRGIRLLFHGLNFCWMEFSGSNAPNNTKAHDDNDTTNGEAKEEKKKRRKHTTRMNALCTETVTLVWRLMDGCVFSVCVDESGERTHSRTYHPYRNWIFSFGLTVSAQSTRYHHMQTRRIHFNLFFP